MNDALIDFLPAYWRERRGRRRFWIIRGVLVITVLSGLSAHGVYTHRTRLDDRQRVSDGERRYQLAVGRISEVEQLEAKKTLLAGRLAHLRGVLAHVRGADIVHAVGRACTPSISLTRLELGYRAEDSGDRVMTVSLRGICPDTMEGTTFERRLQDDALLSSARMVRTDPIDAYHEEKTFLITAVASPMNLMEVVTDDEGAADDSTWVGTPADDAAERP